MKRSARRCWKRHSKRPLSRLVKPDHPLRHIAASRKEVHYVRICRITKRYCSTWRPCVRSPGRIRGFVPFTKAMKRRWAGTERKFLDRPSGLPKGEETRTCPRKEQSHPNSSKKEFAISAKIRCTLSPQGQRNQIKKGKSGRRLQNIDIEIKAEDVDLFDVDEDGNLSFTLALAPLDDLPERSEVIQLVQEAIEKKKSATALQEREDE